MDLRRAPSRSTVPSSARSISRAPRCSRSALPCSQPDRAASPCRVSQGDTNTGPGCSPKTRPPRCPSPDPCTPTSRVAPQSTRKPRGNTRARPPSLRVPCCDEDRSSSPAPSVDGDQVRGRIRRGVVHPINDETHRAREIQPTPSLSRRRRRVEGVPVLVEAFHRARAVDCHGAQQRRARRQLVAGCFRSGGVEPVGEVLAQQRHRTRGERGVAIDVPLNFTAAHMFPESVRYALSMESPGATKSGLTRPSCRPAG